jgi:hypothetical protein
MQNIKDFILIINNRITRLVLIYIGIIFFVLVAFMLGRLTTIKTSRIPIKIVQSNYLEKSVSVLDIENSEALNAEKDVNNTNGNMNNINTINKSLIFGSKKGKYFYYKGCGGNTIAKKNLVYYKNEAAAIAAGKLLYDKCK